MWSEQGILSDLQPFHRLLIFADCNTGWPKNTFVSVVSSQHHLYIILQKSVILCVCVRDACDWSADLCTCASTLLVLAATGTVS